MIWNNIPLTNDLRIYAVPWKAGVMLLESRPLLQTARIAHHQEALISCVKGRPRIRLTILTHMQKHTITTDPGGCIEMRCDIVELEHLIYQTIAGLKEAH